MNGLRVTRKDSSGTTLLKDIMEWIDMQQKRILVILVFLFLFISCAKKYTINHDHPYHPSPAIKYNCPYDSCPYPPFFHEHKGYGRHQHEYKGEYE